jgi:uncharacterized protein
MELIKSLVRFGKRRASQLNKNIHFSVTTNGTLISEDIVRFSKENDILFHLSIDGTPDIQNYNRPLTTGQPSSHLVESGAQKMLCVQPLLTSRASVIPENVSNMFETYQYFRNLSFMKITFVPTEIIRWDVKTLSLFETQLFLIADSLIDEFRHENYVEVTGFKKYFIKKNQTSRGKIACGAGRSLVLIDVNGNIWPCSRFSDKDESQWCFGNIYFKIITLLNMCIIRFQIYAVFKERQKRR